ncbi:MAG: chloramphenicol phosphotransferase CPT family protein [Oscillospiraceae bacterium]|nr:chloramphenicol phosphotransferase CPT family protein [Oscillospiraceae bacterium]
MNWGHIICLNGVTSSGKTSIAKEIQNISDQNYYHISLDMFEQMANLKYRIKAYYTELNDCVTVMYETVSSFAKLGKNVILDTVLLNIPEYPNIYERLVEVCKGIIIYNIHVICPLEECKRRNISRGDRIVTLSEWHNERMIDIPYFYTIDTMSKSSIECAKEILEQIEKNDTILCKQE